MNLPSAYLDRMRSLLGADFDRFIQSYNLPAVKGIRVNTLKISVDEFKKLSPFGLEEVPWEDSGFYVSEDGLGKTVYHAAGLYYVQEPSAMCAAPLLEVKDGERVLDLCSAPGGKGTQLAQRMRGGGLLVLNEINRKRYEILCGNVERMGVKNVCVTCASPESLAERFADFFDKILVDAPCSGEGMFRKDEGAVSEWSLKNVQMCAERQTAILRCADRMLAGGGRLVYSTCTFSSEEDEGQIENFLKGHKEYKLLEMKKLYPHEIRGEGHFCAALEKTCGERRGLREIEPTVRDKQLLRLYREWESGTLNVKIPEITQRCGSLYYVGGMPDDSLFKGMTVSSGVYLGGISSDGKRFEPSHRLAMSLERGAAKSIDVDEQTALKYLRGLTFECGDETGWRVVTFGGHPLGWCKAVGGIAKNRLPKGVRI